MGIIGAQIYIYKSGLHWGTKHMVKVGTNRLSFGKSKRVPYYPSLLIQEDEVEEEEEEEEEEEGGKIWYSFTFTKTEPICA